MAKLSAGLLLHRYRDEDLQVFLVHPGGPFWANKDEGAWSIPKGEFEPGEDPLAAAQREFREETGFVASGEFVPLTPLRQRSGKIVHAWGVEMDCDPALVRSNTFTWKGRTYPEIDRASWFTLAEARQKILPGQVGFLDQLIRGSAADRGGFGAPDNNRGPSAADPRSAKTSKTPAPPRSRHR